MVEIKSKQAIQRTKLETVIPLETPLEVQMAVASICNFKCIYCPMTKVRSKKGIMSFKLFKKIIDDLDEFPGKVKTIRLMREGEPLLNKRFVDMVRYAKLKQPTAIVDTVTNASLLTHKLSDEILAAGLDKLHISFQGMNSEVWKRLCGVTINFDRLVENILYFCNHRKNCKVFIKVPDIGVTEEEKKAFFDLFGPHVDEMTEECIFPAWPNWDVSHLQKDPNMGYYGKPKTDTVKVCAIPFYDLSIDYKGIVSACCNDWEDKTNMGDMNKQSLYEIWNGKKLNDFRRMQLQGKRFEDELCKDCHALEYCKPDIIDEYAPQLLEKYKELL